MTVLFGFRQVWLKASQSVQKAPSSALSVTIGPWKCLMLSTSTWSTCWSWGEFELQSYSGKARKTDNFIFSLAPPLCSFHPGQSEWIYNPGDAICTVACSEKSTGKIFIYDGRGGNQALHAFDKMHSSPLSQIRLNHKFRVIVSADKAGMLEYWTGLPSEFRFPKQVHWKYKTDTDLYEFAKHKTYPTSLVFSWDGKKMATIATDRKVRIFRFLTGKLMRVFDESLSVSSCTSSSQSRNSRGFLPRLTQHPNTLNFLC